MARASSTNAMAAQAEAALRSAESLCQSGAEWAERSADEPLGLSGSPEEPASIAWRMLGGDLAALARLDWRICRRLGQDMLDVAWQAGPRRGPRGAAMQIGSVASLLAECSRAESAGEIAMPSWTFEDARHPQFWAGQSPTETQHGHAWTGLAGPAPEGADQAAWAGALILISRQGLRGPSPTWQGEHACPRASELATRWGLGAGAAISPAESAMIGAAFARFEIGIETWSASDGAAQPAQPRRPRL